MKKICVLSGKGGVGKSSITASLAVVLSETRKVITADCDVDASNLALVLGLREKDFKECWEISTNKKATLVEKKCNHCGKCKNSCYFGAIKWNKEKRIPEFDQMKCEGCGACAIVCPTNAIQLVEKKNARICIGRTKFGFEVVSGQLKTGEAGSGKVVAEVKKIAMEKGKKAEILLIDAAAGIGCPVIASVTGSDFVVAVTEPTPSGLSDLKRALSVVKHFGIPFGIVINKHDLNPKIAREIERFAKSQNAEVLSKIPFNESFVEALVELKPIVEFDKKTRWFFEEIIRKIPLG